MVLSPNCESQRPSARAIGGLPANGPVLRRRWSRFGFTCRELVEVLIDGVGNGCVGEWERVRVLAQRCCRIGVPESRLGLEDLASLDEERGHVVPEAMKRRPFHARSARKTCESVAKGSGRQPSAVVEDGAEQPSSATK